MECPNCKALQDENQKLRSLIQRMADNSEFIKFLAVKGLEEIDKAKKEKK